MSDKNIITCTAVRGCTNIAMFVSPTTLYCEGCLEKFKGYGYTDGMYWEGLRSNYCRSKKNFHTALKPVVMNVELYKSLPEGLKALSIPMKAFMYCAEVLSAPSDMFEELIASDLDLGLRYAELKGSRVISMENKLLDHIKSDLWCPDGQGNENLLNYVSNIYKSSSYIHGKYYKGKLSSEYYSRELESNLLQSPSNIYRLSSYRGRRIVRAENTVFHSFDFAQKYIRSVCFKDRERFIKFEKFINNLYSTYFNEKEQRINKEKLNRYCKRCTDYVTLILNRIASFENKDVKQLKNYLNKFSKVTRDLDTLLNMTFKKRTKIIVGKSLHDSIYFNGGTHLIDYVLERRQSRWIEAEPFMAKSIGSNVLDYLHKYVKDSCAILEEGIVREDIYLSIGYINTVVPYVTDFFTLEVLFNKEYGEEKIPCKGIEFYRTLIGFLGEGKLNKLHPTTVQIISTSSELSYHLVFCTEKRFPEGEVVIMNDSNYRNRYIELLKSIR